MQFWGKQSQTAIHAIKHLIGSRERLLKKNSIFHKLKICLFAIRLAAFERWMQQNPAAVRPMFSLWSGSLTHFYPPLRFRN